MVALGTLLTGDTGAAVPVILGFLLAGIAAFWRVPKTSSGR
jgi:LPXTG-motif cell wall-anchored protein